MSSQPPSGLLIRNLDDGRFDQAYPLARTMLPNLSLVEWRRFLDEHLKQDASGIVVVENQGGVMFACAIYRARHDLRLGRCLEVDPLIVMDLVGAATLAKTLDIGLLTHARRLGCSSMRLQLPRRNGAGAEDRAVSAFLGCGLAADALRLSKQVEVLAH